MSATATLLTLLAFAATSRGELSRHELCDDQLIFHQLLGGVDVAVPEKAVSLAQRNVFTMAKGMKNFMYVVGDAVTKECVVIDACYDPEGVLAAAESLGCNVTAALGTHFHYDHIGHENKPGSIGGPGFALPGLRYFIQDLELPAYVHASERDAAAAQIDVPPASLTPLSDGEALRVGAVELRVIHTPGHSPGGMTLVAVVDGEERAVITGDTIFPGSCGRLDLPGSSVDAMFKSLRHLRNTLDDKLPLYPGHAYNGESSTVAREKTQGLLRPFTASEWTRMMRR